VAIVIGDIHGDVSKAQTFLAYKPNEVHIALGDLVDSRSKVGFDSELECLDLLLASDAVLLWGNHDLAYLPERPWRCFGSFDGFAFRERYQSARNRFLAAYAADDWLCTHAGVSPKLAILMPAWVISGGAEAIAGWLNLEFIKHLQISITDVASGEQRFGFGPIFNVPVCRGGAHEYGGIFWFDAEGEQSQPSPSAGRQIFGHSPVLSPERGKSWNFNKADFESGDKWTEWINLDVRDGAWIYNTKTDEILNLWAL
jgi:hypothetical protein